MQDTPMGTEALPHLIFRVKSSLYAVNCENVSSIIQYAGCENIPQSTPETPGIILFRGKAVPVLDLRTVFGQISVDQEQREFMEMLDLRKEDHIHWVRELERCVETEERFTLATDPHQCAFGKWYDSYTTDINTVMFHLRKIREPHDQLHQAALDVARCKQNHDECRREVCLKVILQQAQEQHMPRVLRLLDEAKKLFSENHRQMLIVLGEAAPIALLVDEVVSAELLEEEGPLNNGGEGLITSIMRGKQASSAILLVDEEELLRRYQRDQHQPA